jgi:hypothetical protein
LSPKLQANFDATKLVFFSDEQGKLVKVKWDKNFKEPPRTHVISRQQNKKLPLCSKFFHLQTAGLMVAPVCVQFADENMGEDDIAVYKVPGLSPYLTPGQYGYVVFTKTRAGNAKFFAWLFDTYISFMIQVICVDIYMNIHMYVYIYIYI